MSETMIRLENVSKSYDGGKTFAVRDVNMSIEKGEFIALLGPSGCGKSTTLMMLCGLYRPTTGNIYFRDRIVNNVQPKDRNIGMVFQSYALYPNMNVFNNIAFPLRQQKGMKKDEITEKVLEVARIVKIEELLKRMPAQLSGGQQQRVAMCRALVKKPDILMLDEPMSNLDARLKLEIRDEIKKLQAELKLTSIIVTHDQEEAMAVADRIVVIDKGNIQQMAEPDALYDTPDNIFVASFIGTPPMNLIDGKISFRDGLAVCHLSCGDFAFSDKFIDKNKPVSENIVFGIRPHQFVVTEEEENSFLLDIDYIEHLGKDILLKCYIGETCIRILVPAKKGVLNMEQIRVRPDVNGMNIFNKDTGINITRRTV